ncbi:MAG TPA: hypothetical protein VLX92_05345 [Kofleriaceae bacterium]|nr:hypothetical protein [Kofleriaceae bacterium]
MRSAFLLVLAGCSSLVSDPCESGYALAGGHCIARDEVDAGPGGMPRDAGPLADAGPARDGGAPIDAFVCTADIMSDPDNCGACGTVCASGVCISGACNVAVPGHVIAIGHDYQHHHATMARVLGDAVALGVHPDVAVARWNGTASEDAVAGTTAALAEAMTDIGRPWHAVAMPAMPSATALDLIDVVLVDAQIGDGDAAEAAAAPWASTLSAFLSRGGVVVVLEGSGGVSYRVAHGAGLYDAGAPQDVTDQLAYVVVGTDAIAQQVISPYLAETTSVTMPGLTGAVIQTITGGTIAYHAAHP